MRLTNQGNKESAEDHARRVREMFARISGRYDLLNHLLSANIDRRWRRAVTRKLRTMIADSPLVLDVACGTGDLTNAIFDKASARIIGIDFCRPMLEKARAKYPQLSFVEADALHLPFASETFDAATIGFGLRNLSSINQGLHELRRVLRDHGWLIVLEFSKPTVPGFSALATAYCNRLLPRIGGIISGSRVAYEYLPDSVSRFPDQNQLSRLMTESGFAKVGFDNLTGGIAALHYGQRV